jgi:hypothetical protein
MIQIVQKDVLKLNILNWEYVINFKNKIFLKI